MRKILKRSGWLGALAVGFTALLSANNANAGTYDITVDRITIDTGVFKREGIGYNKSSPGPVLRFREGENVTINVTNNLDEATSVHWHGLILPYQMDGVPDISYDGIAPGETFSYAFPVVQSGTYWFHSHSGFQEPDGAYGSIIIEPKEPDPIQYDREYIVQLTDAHPQVGAIIMENLKTPEGDMGQMQMNGDSAMSDNSMAADNMASGDMDMDMMSDIEDVEGYTPLINGKSAGQNWTGIFNPGERVRLRFINSSAMAYFDVRIPGLKMTVVAADGNAVAPVEVDEFRMSVAETYDVIVTPPADTAYTIFAESMARSAYGRGTLAPRGGMTAQVPALRKPPVLTQADMGMMNGGMMDMMGGDMQGMGQSDMPMDMPMGDMPMDMPMGDMPMGDMQMGATTTEEMSQSQMPDMNMSGSNISGDPFYAPGSGLTPVAANGGKFLSYADLRAVRPLYEDRDATREIELRLTGDMATYVWSINGKTYEEDEIIPLVYGERVRFKFVNETMMAHPMHLHGMWSILDTGAGEMNPAKHTINIAPNTTVYMETEVDASGQWAFHCHLAYHADAGMFRRVVVEGGPESG